MRYRVLLPGKIESQSRFVAFAGLREVEGERAFFHYRLYLSSLFLQK